MIDFKRLYKHMKEPFELCFRIVKRLISVDNIIMLLVIIVGAVLIIGFLGLPMGILIYLNDHHRLSNEILQAGIALETIWFFYWLYVSVKYGNVQVWID